MKARLETKHPRIRCQQCGDARVIAVCHHCGAALCAEHGRETAGRVGLSVEFTGLDLDPGRGAHCGRCAHTLTEPMSLAPVLGLVIGGVVVGGAGLSLGAAVVGLGGLLLLAGGVAALMRSQQWQHLKARRPEFPALPQLRSFEVRETLRARQELQADGRSTVAVLEATGRASVLATQSRSNRTSASVKSTHCPCAACPIRSQPHCLPFQPWGSGWVGTTRTRASSATRRARIAGVASVLWSS